MNVKLTNLEIVVYIIIINSLIGALYLISRLIKKDYKRGIIMTLFIILTPPIGTLYLTISWLIYVLYFKNRTGILSIEELSLRKDKIEVTVKDDLRTAFNKVPLEEALIVSEGKDTRRLILDILKEERGDYIKSIYHATDNKDSEVSHYAATAITDIIDKFKEQEKIFRHEYSEDKKNIAIAERYWDYLSDFLMTKILSSVEQLRFLKILEDLTLDLEANTPEIVRAELYYRIVSISIDLDRMVQAELWVSKALNNRKNSLASYKAGLKFYYSNGEHGKFRSLLSALKSSDIRLDNETLEMIRFYS